MFGLSSHNEFKEQLERTFAASNAKLAKAESAVEAAFEALKTEREARINDLKSQIEEQRIEIRRLTSVNESLTDRLLLRNNISPLHSSETRKESSPSFSGFTPFGAIPDQDPLMKESFMNEELSHLVYEEGLDLMEAKEQAEKNYQLKYGILGT